MPKNDEGEFELVLGNKQLLSVFFIVVVLLGVFFTMGYIVGRNTAGDAVQVAQTPGQPLVVESENAPPAAAPVATPPPAAKPPAAAKPAPAKTPAPKPAAAKPKPAPPKPAPITERPPTTAKPTPRPTPPPAASPSGVSMPASGTVYLQVAATSVPEGEVLRDVLRKRGFRAQLAPVPGQELVRVLVGPVAGNDEISQTRTKLQGAGFKPFTRRY
jgi:cell division septation protein DedD